MEIARVATLNKYLEFLLKNKLAHDSKFARTDYFSQNYTRYEGNPPPFRSSGAEFLLFSSATAAFMNMNLSCNLSPGNYAFINKSIRSNSMYLSRK